MLATGRRGKSANGSHWLRSLFATTLHAHRSVCTRQPTILCGRHIVIRTPYLAGGARYRTQGRSLARVVSYPGSCFRAGADACSNAVAPAASRPGRRLGTGPARGDGAPDRIRDACRRAAGLRPWMPHSWHTRSRLPFTLHGHLPPDVATQASRTSHDEQSATSITRSDEAMGPQTPIHEGRMCVGRRRMALLHSDRFRSCPFRGRSCHLSA
jgi:hypothetical protein